MFAIIGWIGRILLILLIIRMIVNFFAGARKATSAPGASSPPGAGRPDGAERIGAKLVRDPQCGTYVAESTAIAARHSGELLHFCSETCRDQYMAAPSKTAV